MVYNTNYTDKDYNLVMNLRKKELGVIKIYRYLINKKVSITKGAIGRWVYRNGKIFQKQKINSIKEDYGILTISKAYIFGVLCGDGYVSTNYRTGLNANDLDFVEEFRNCIKKVYGLNCNIKQRPARKTNYGQGKIQYSAVLSSKKAWHDILRYNSFKTKNWKVPKEILECEDSKIISAFIKGLFDSEGTIRLRRNGYAELQVCSGNKESLLIVKDMLLKNFDINMKIKEDRGCVVVISTETYKDIKNFYDKINFTIKRKKEKLEYALSTYKRTNLRHYNDEFKLKVFELLDQGYGKREIGRMLNFSHTNIYDFIRQKAGLIKTEFEKNAKARRN